VTASGGVQPGCMIKILEAERWLNGTNFHEVAFLQRKGGRIAAVPPSGGSEGGKTRCIREREDMVAFQGGRPPFKGDSPYLRPQPSWAESSPTRSKVLPQRRGGWLPRVMQAGPEQKKPNHRARCMQPPSGYEHSSTFAQTSGRKGGQPCRRHATAVVGAPLRLPTRPAWRPRPTRHATGAPVATCEQLHCHPHHYRASSTAEPVPRLEATQRTTQQRQPGAMVNAAKNGPTVMAVAGGQEQRSRHQPSLRPIQGQRENPLSRREDGVPVFRSSNGSRTRNGRPANHSPRRINSAAGQAAPLAGEASNASPSP
jgi:hypothetical protein